jgi:hypothetical protein
MAIMAIMVSDENFPGSDLSDSLTLVDLVFNSLALSTWHTVVVKTPKVLGITKLKTLKHFFDIH